MGRLWLGFAQVVILGAEDSRDLGPRLAVIHGLRDPDDLDQPVHSSGATGSAYVYARCELQKVVQPSMRNASMQLCPGHRPKEKAPEIFRPQGLFGWKPGGDLLWHA